MTSTRIPMRTCVATREVKPCTDLLRVVADPQCAAASSADIARPVTVLVPDPARRLPGRGAWVSIDVAACQQAVARRAFQRALRLHTPVDATAVLDYVERHAQHTR